MHTPTHTMLTPLTQASPPQAPTATPPINSPSSQLHSPCSQATSWRMTKTTRLHALTPSTLRAPCIVGSRRIWGVHRCMLSWVIMIRRLTRLTCRIRFSRNSCPVNLSGVMGIWQSRFYTLALALALSLDALPPFSLWQTEGWISEQVANVTRTTCVLTPSLVFLP